MLYKAIDHCRHRHLVATVERTKSSSSSPTDAPAACRSGSVSPRSSCGSARKYLLRPRMRGSPWFLSSPTVLAARIPSDALATGAVAFESCWRLAPPLPQLAAATLPVGWALNARVDATATATPSEWVRRLAGTSSVIQHDADGPEAARLGWCLLRTVERRTTR